MSNLLDLYSSPMFFALARSIAEQCATEPMQSPRNIIMPSAPHNTRTSSLRESILLTLDWKLWSDPSNGLITFIDTDEKEQYLWKFHQTTDNPQEYIDYYAFNTDGNLYCQRQPLERDATKWDEVNVGEIQKKSTKLCASLFAGLASTRYHLHELYKHTRPPKQEEIPITQ